MIAFLRQNRVRRTYLGGSRIDAFTGTAADVSDGTPRPEDWLASTVTAFNGTKEIAGEGLGRLADGRLVKDVAGDLPILVKLLDSDERLVIQAHPTVPCARRLFGSSVGKTECWYFLDGTTPDACVYLGFKPGVTRERWEKAVCEDVQGRNLPNHLLSFLHCIPVQAGDFVFVDGGMPHAIGGGCFMVELQEPSDLMVVAERFTPSGRRIPDAKMHGGVGWKAMFDVYEYEGRTFEETCARYVKTHSSHVSNDRRSPLPANVNATRIVGPALTDKFEMWRMTGGGRLDLPCPVSVVVVTDGVGEANGRAVAKGDRLLVADERILAVNGDVTLVVCTVPRRSVV